MEMELNSQLQILYNTFKIDLIVWKFFIGQIDMEVIFTV